MQRKLAAILSADAQGYSRLMAEDDSATVRLLGTCRELVAGAIAAHRGRVVDMPGDNVLAEFASAVDAMQAALAMQAQLTECNAALPDARRLAFRVGINLGDVIEDEGGRIYGDGVNVAARLQALAEAGGICVSGKVHAELRRRPELAFEDLGERELHNIASPVRVYRLRPAGRAAPRAAPSSGPGKPSIIVLPFTNMSGDPEQEFFADGLTEDILTDLSRFHELFVISRNTSARYKGKAVDVRAVAKECAVQYVVEGSVRKSGSRVRVTVQLIDAEADAHIWAERYDRQLDDIFALQDEVTKAIVATLPGRVAAAARDRAERKPTENMAAYECVLAAKVLHHRSQREENARAAQLIERAIALDPQYAHAHAWKACILGQQWGYGWCADRAATENLVREELETALSLDDKDSDVHRILAAVDIVQNDLQKAIYHQQRALALNPNDDLIVVQQGELLTWLGEPEAGIEWIRKAMRLNPFHPPRFWSHLARALFAARRYAEAADALQRLAAPDFLNLALLAGCCAALGDGAAARARAGEVAKRKADFSVERDCVPTLHYKRPADLQHHREALLKAGLPA
ncbi:MAG TPA: adenylate/guanylate cyclase domain-containing protein [Burkholderiales bacterium]|nr:adenylate/guanylate cyclase domain-containing protein [Burkholderiales bacterium]